MKQQSRGFTLVEIMVTIVLIMIVVGSLSDMFISVQNLQQRSFYTDQATRAASREIESLRNNNYGSLTPGQTINFTSQLPSGLPQGSSGSAVISQPATDLRRVDVSVNYPFDGRTNTVSVSSLIGVIGIAK